MRDERPWAKDCPPCDFNGGGECIAKVYEACQCKDAEYQRAKHFREQSKKQKRDAR